MRGGAGVNDQCADFDRRTSTLAGPSILRALLQLHVVDGDVGAFEIEVGGILVLATARADDQPADMQVDGMAQFEDIRKSTGVETHGMKIDDDFRDFADGDIAPINANGSTTTATQNNNLKRGTIIGWSSSFSLFVHGFMPEPKQAEA